MSKGDEYVESREEQASDDWSATHPEDQENLRDAYDEVESPTEFHIVVEQDGKPSAVPSSGAIRCPPAIEMVYVAFADAIEHQIYMVEMELNIEPTSNEGNTSIQRTHQLRKEGNSEFDVPWAVEVTLEERPDGWIAPTELKFEGLAEQIPLGQTPELGVEGGPDVLRNIV